MRRAALTISALAALAFSLPDCAHGHRRPGTAPPVPRTARAMLVELFERGRRATWEVEFEFSRRVRTGRTLAGTETEANRPPDHVVAGMGGVSGVRAGHRLTCADVNTKPVCTSGAPAPDFAADIAEQVRNLEAVLNAPLDWYEIARVTTITVTSEHGRCFTMRLVRPVPVPPYGEQTEMCFAGDGVPLRTRVVRVEATDERTAVRTRRTVSNADLDGLVAGR